MAALLAGAVWACLIGWLMLRLLGQFRTYRATSLDFPEGAPAFLPAVAVIVPARNEIANIKTCLAGLTAQRTARRFRQKSHDLGEGVDFSNVGDAIETLDGPRAR